MRKFNLLTVLVILTTIFIISSCKKEEEKSTTTQTTPAIPKVLKEVVQIAGEPDNTINYTYDATGKLIKITESADTSYSDISYETGKVTIKEYAGAVPALRHLYIYTLDANGRASSLIDSGYATNSAKNKFINNLKLKSINSDKSNTNYTYNSDGYLTNEVAISGTGIQASTYTMNYTYTNGNNTSLSGSISFWGSTIPITGTCDYYTDKTNTIGDENHGITFKGKSTKNLGKSMAVTITGMSNVTGNITFEFDTKGRVSKEVQTTINLDLINNSSTTTTTTTVYTYTD